MSKPQITHIAAIGIIYRARNPKEILMQVKDDKHPRDIARRGLSAFGGNRTGEAAKNDRGPLDTFKRRTIAELTLENPTARIWLDEIETYPPGGFVTKTHTRHVEANDGDRAQLEAVCLAITMGSRPYRSFLNREPDGRQALVTVFTCGLDETTWEQLKSLHQRFGNISNQGWSVVTSLGEIAEVRTKSAFGMHGALKAFWRTTHQSGTNQLPIEDDTIANWLGEPLATYAEYEELYDIAPTSISP